MPPTNSPNASSPQTSGATSPLIEQLNGLSSPVPDLAATLLNSLPEREAMEGTTTTATSSPSSRHRVHSTSLSRVHPSRQPYLTEDEFRRFTTESRRRVQRNIESSRRSAEASSYANRTTHRQNLYDWAAASGNDESGDEEGRQQRHRASDLQRQMNDFEDWFDLDDNLDTHRYRRNQSWRRPEPATPPTLSADLDVLRQVAYNREALTAAASTLERAERRREERMQSLLEGSRNQRLRHPASRERILHAMQEFMAERDRHSQDREDPTSSRAAHSTLPRSERTDDGLKERQRPKCVRVRNMIEYLSRLRDCDFTNLEEAAALATELDIRMTKDDDIVAETKSIPPPPWTSLLTAGSVFTGSQHAPNDGSGAHLLNRDRDYLRRMVASRNLSSAHLPRSFAALADAERYLLDHPPSRTHTSMVTSRSQHRPPDHWPVSVNLHSVDMESMTVTGTMSANHIPDKTAPTSPDHKPEGSSMKSYFEGEIIDMNKFTLETETYKHEGVAVDVDTDAEYWKQLGPFREVVEKAAEGEIGAIPTQNKADFQLAACLASTDWLKRVIGEEWILMRWKERCFLPPSDSNSWGLTISGFYYIALNRRTGRIEGLYYDPGSQPYQRLDLVLEGSENVQTSEDSASGSNSSMHDVGAVKKWFPSVEFGRDGYKCLA